MTRQNDDAKYWGRFGKDATKWTSFDDLLAEQYRRVHLDLLARWVDVSHSQMILKTDLFAEALQPSRAFLWEMLQENSSIVGMDISAGVASQAKTNAEQSVQNSTAGYVNCDVRCLPFAKGSFDLIVSDSTLDHFAIKDDILVALSEVSRVLKPGGSLVITMDNKTNLTEPLFRLWISLGLSNFFIGKTYSMRELKQALTSVGLQVMDTTAIIHNPRFFARRAIALLHKGNDIRFNRWIGKVLALLDGLERRRTRNLTAQFIAAKAVKPAE